MSVGAIPGPPPSAPDPRERLDGQLSAPVAQRLSICPRRMERIGTGQVPYQLRRHYVPRRRMCSQRSGALNTSDGAGFGDDAQRWHPRPHLSSS